MKEISNFLLEWCVDVAGDDADIAVASVTQGYPSRTFK